MPWIKIAAEPISKIGCSAPPRLIASKNIRYITSRKIGTPSQRLRITLSSVAVRRFGIACCELLTTSHRVVID
ncbi:hypothetical protein D3C80_1980060 [compost metagenome]